MGKKPVITAAEAAKMVQDGMTFTTSGFVASAMPEALNKALEQRFLESGSPKDLTLFYAAAQGNDQVAAGEACGQEGLLQGGVGRKSFGALPMGKDKALRAEARAPEGALRRRTIEGGYRVIRNHHHGPGGGEKAPQLRAQVGQ